MDLLRGEKARSRSHVLLMTGSQTFTACLKSLAKPDVVWVSQSSRTSCCTGADHQPPLRASFMFVLMSGGFCCQSDVMIVSAVEVQQQLVLLVTQEGKQQPGRGKTTKQLKGSTKYGSNTHNNTYTETYRGTHTHIHTDPRTSRSSCFCPD